MKIGDLFRRSTVDNPLIQSNATQAGTTNVVGSDKAQEQTSRSAEDWVTISPEARKYARISSAVENDAISRQSKVDDIKRRVDSGDYNVSSDVVAKSILSYFE